MRTPVKFRLVRHAESEANIDSSRFGDGGISLTDKGLFEVAALHHYIDQHGFFGSPKGILRDRGPILLDGVWSSCMKRACDTADGVAPALPWKTENIIREARWNELSHGEWETGKHNRKTVFGDPKEQRKMKFLGMDHRGPGPAESLHIVGARIGEWLFELDEDFYERRHELAIHSRPRNVLVFTHGGAIRAFLQRALGLNVRDAWQHSIDNTSITCIEALPDGTWKLHYVNHTPHLGPRI